MDSVVTKIQFACDASNTKEVVEFTKKKKKKIGKSQIQSNR